MTIDEWTKELEKSAKDFREMWQRGHESDPKGYPDELEDSEWFEQFLTYLDN